MGKPPYSKDQRENRTSNTLALRTEIREQSLGTTDGNIRILKSLQTCYLKDNMKVLDEHIAKLNLEETLSHLRGLKEVLQMLQGQLPNENGKDTKQSFMDFNEAFALFLSYSKDTSSLDLGQRHKRKRFKELLCPPKYGLCVHVVMEKFIVLRADDVDLEFFFEELTKSIHYDFKSVDENSRITLNSELVENIINSMYSEWDKNIVRVILGSTRSRAEINKLGIDSHDIKQLTEKVLEVLEERKNAKLAASDMVTLRLKSRMESIDSNINSKELILQRKTHDWTEHQLGELSDDITSLKEQKEDLETLLNPSTKYERKRIGEMI